MLRAYSHDNQREGTSRSMGYCSSVSSRAISPKLRRIIMSKILRSSSVLGPPAPGELDHAFVAEEEGETRELSAVAICFEETYVPSLSVGEGHEHAVRTGLWRGKLHS